VSLTPTDAMKLWCPFSRAPIRMHTSEFASETAPVAGNRTERGLPNQNCHCLAAGCMAWRWKEKGKGECGLVPQPLPINGVTQ